MRATSPVKRALLFALVAPLAGLAACVQGYSTTAPSTPSGCTTEIVPALALAVRDSVTHQATASGILVGGSVSGKQGNYAITAPLASDTLTLWIGTISGTYNVSLHKAGYRDVTKSGIVVPSADSLDCHPQTVSLDVLLQPTS